MRCLNNYTYFGSSDVFKVELFWEMWGRIMKDNIFENILMNLRTIPYRAKKSSFLHLWDQNYFTQVAWISALPHLCILYSVNKYFCSVWWDSFKICTVICFVKKCTLPIHRSLFLRAFFTPFFYAKILLFNEFFCHPGV